MSFDGFPLDAAKFLTELRANNNRDWFNDHKQRYEDSVRGPALEFIAAMEKPLRKISPFLSAQPKKVGGSLMRIYRDVRFSKDKTPYQTHIGIQFRHEAGKDVHAPGVYLHYSPEAKAKANDPVAADDWKDRCFFAGGIWHPDREPLAAIRDAIAANPSAWKKATTGKKFDADWQLGGESLKRPPRGYDADHPAIEEIKRKDFIASCDVSPSVWTGRDLCDVVVGQLKSLRPMLRFLGEATGMPM